MKTKIEKWWKRFGELEPGFMQRSIDVSPEKLKSFIAQLLAEEREHFKKMIINEVKNCNKLKIPTRGLRTLWLKVKKWQQ